MWTMKDLADAKVDRAKIASPMEVVTLLLDVGMSQGDAVAMVDAINAMPDGSKEQWEAGIYTFGVIDGIRMMQRVALRMSNGEQG